MLDKVYEEKLCALLKALVDQEAATVVVPPQKAAQGYWFGGGNLARDEDGTLWLVGRYRNAGDSTTGLAKGERGLELALFASQDKGASFAKVRSWSKADLGVEKPVLSIEGADLHRRDDGTWELFVSTEKEQAYPPEVAAFQKPGTGVWSIDVLRGPSPGEVGTAGLSPVFEPPADPCYLHVKDPVTYDDISGDTYLLYCSHPFCWTSSNTGYAVRPTGLAGFDVRSQAFVARGPAWDVAGTRVTCRMPVPRLGVFDVLPAISIFFYDGLECVRPHETNPLGVARPRGYSCEELGGACYGLDCVAPQLVRLSGTRPLFVSPHGTGCSRYLSALVLEDSILATWQQSQPDGSQPLVAHRLPLEVAARLLS